MPNSDKIIHEHTIKKLVNILIKKWVKSIKMELLRSIPEKVIQFISHAFTRLVEKREEGVMGGN